MSFFLKWLRAGTSAKISLRPRQDVTLASNYGDAYAKTLDAVERILGANPTVNDKPGKLIEASFGLVNSERIRISFESKSETETTVRIEALYPAGAAIPADSRAVTTLANALRHPSTSSG